MNRIELLLHELTITFDQEDWFPPLQHAIQGVSAEQACWRPEGEAANTIWENVNHLIYYKERLVSNLEGQQWNHAKDNDATFHITVQSNDEDAWNATVQRAEEVHRRIQNIIKSKMDADFDVDSLGKSLTSIILHDAYHTGQIVQIRKLQGSWPAQRSFE